MPDGSVQKTKVAVPWFAVGFLAVIGFNSFDLLPVPVVDAINYVDTFLLTMAMAALGAETSIDKFKKAGAKPFILAFWLISLADIRRVYAGQISCPDLAIGASPKAIPTQAVGTNIIYIMRPPSPIFRFCRRPQV